MNSVRCLVCKLPSLHIFFRQRREGENIQTLANIENKLTDDIIAKIQRNMAEDFDIEALLEAPYNVSIDKNNATQNFSTKQISRYEYRK